MAGAALARIITQKYEASLRRAKRLKREDVLELSVEAADSD
jgi:hypothetical protein